MNLDWQKQVSLEVTQLKTTEGNYQTLLINLLPPRELIAPDILPHLELPGELDLNREVILFGQAPIWLYVNLTKRCRSVPWLACYDARKNLAVIVQSQVAEKAPGDTISASLNQTPCPAILIGGLPDSGKSVLANTLRWDLLKKNLNKQIFLHRSNWDGQGNWAYETANRQLVERLVRENEFRIHENDLTRHLIPDYFEKNSRDVKNLRELVDLVIVDVGGKPQLEKIPLVEQCTHYIIISKSPEKIGEWHELCRPKLQPLAVIHSVLEKTIEVLSTNPFLEIVAGIWREGEMLTVPDVLLEPVLREIRWHRNY
ncbi:CRISPR-associated ring nuclease Crn3/Csx3 [Microseira sp. BLCC-F43]|jgi:CRISPR-associated protein Csx3|uniref:CRISPR-associated ring nuclease Crn3/Csx3 n=1 Tax=Microseira sp. BLCC-F43 TaxID=3153602 RepID=UPI0035B8B11B